MTAASVHATAHLGLHLRELGPLRVVQHRVDLAPRALHERVELRAALRARRARAERFALGVRAREDAADQPDLVLVEREALREVRDAVLHALGREGSAAPPVVTAGSI